MMDLGYSGPCLVWHLVCIDAVDVGIGVIELGRNIVSVRVGASGTGVESRAQPKVALGWAWKGIRLGSESDCVQTL